MAMLWWSHCKVASLHTFWLSRPLGFWVPGRDLVQTCRSVARGWESGCKWQPRRLGCIPFFGDYHSIFCWEDSDLVCLDTFCCKSCRIPSRYQALSVTMGICNTPLDARKMGVAGNDNVIWTSRSRMVQDTTKLVSSFYRLEISSDLVCRFWFLVVK